MTETFKDLEILQEMFKEIKMIKKAFENRVEKKWFTIKELAEYLDYSQDRLHKLKGDEFIEGIHYYKRKGKLLFDKYKVDEWVVGKSSSCL